MAEGDGRGPAVPDHEDAYRAVLYPDWWVEGENRPSTATFNHRKFSVDVASRTTPQQTAARFRDVTRLVKFNCGTARTLTFDTRDEPDEHFPENRAHAHVYFDDFDQGRKSRKRRVRRLIDHCSVVDLA